MRKNRKTLPSGLTKNKMLKLAEELKISAGEVKNAVHIDVQRLNDESTEILSDRDWKKLDQFVAEQKALASPEGFAATIRDAKQSEAFINWGALKQRFTGAAFDQWAQNKDLPANPVQRRRIANEVNTQRQKAVQRTMGLD